MKSKFFIKDQKLDKTTLISNKPLSSLHWDGDDGDEEESGDSQWLARARRLQARRWRKIKHKLA